MGADKAAHEADVAQVRARLLEWYRRVRRDLPWRRTRDPYAIWVSEVMLQQTRVETVIPYYARFMKALPNVHALAEAPLDRVLELWSGLGYYRRARLLHRGAKDVTSAHGGVVPRDAKSLRAISGVGRYTAGAIASIAYDEEAPIVDGNVARVLARLAGRDLDDKTLWSRAEELARGRAPGDLNQALMELGATVCTPKNPSCAACPIASDCIARARDVQDEIPSAAKKAKTKTVALRAYVIEAPAGILVGKRREGALYGGMWEPPMLDHDADGKALFGGAPSEPRGRFVHVLTHRRLEVDVFYIKTRIALKLASFGDYERFEHLPSKELAGRAMSKLARRALDAALAGRRPHFRSL
jgi:A/G-specific adenine glycosylase